jgi:hypothetical protein
MSQILRAFSATVDDVDDSDRTIVSKISVGSVDRYNSLILPRGIDLKAYVKNPVVLFEHGKDVTRGAVPIGRNVWVKLNNQGNTLIAKTRFAKDDFASMLYDFYREGTMTGWSVRLLQKELGGPPTREEARAYPGMDKCDVVYRSTELAEYSCVAVPGQADALTEPELRSMFSEAQLESLSTLVVRGFWTPPDEVKPLVEPVIERMSESNGMASGGALVDDDGDDEDDEDGKKKKKKAKERSADDESGDAIETSADDADAESRSAEDVEAVEVAAEPEADETVTRDAPADEPTEAESPEPIERAGFNPDEPRDNAGEWADDGSDSEKSKVKRRKSRPDGYDEDGRKDASARNHDKATERLQAKYDASPLYKTPDLEDPKTGETFHVKVTKNAAHFDDPGEHKYFVQTVGSKSGLNDGAGFSNLKKAAKYADSAHKAMVKDGLKPKAAARSAPDDVDADDDDFIGEWFDYLDETIVDRSAPEPEPTPAPEVTAAPVVEPAPEPEPVDPLAGLPPLVGRSLEDVTRRNTRLIEAWRKSTETMLGEFEGWLRGEA